MMISIVTLLGTTLLMAGSEFASQNGRFQPASSPLPPPTDHGLTRRQISQVSSSNWAGAVLGAPPPGTKFTTVLGTFTVPDVNPPPNSQTSSYWGGSAWIGIDGWGTEEGLWQAGVGWNVSMVDGTITKTYRSWHEWIPNVETNFLDFDVKAGDNITILCEAPTNTTGICAMQNDRTNMRVSVEMSAPEKGELARQTVEWITEDFTFGSFLVPFANFTKVEWKKCEALATDASGNATLLTPSGGMPTIVNLASGASLLTSTNITGDQVTTFYVNDAKKAVEKL